MTNKEKIADIKYLIMEHYSDKEPLNEDQKKSKQCFYRYCDDIKKELKALEIIKEKKVNVGAFMECCLSLSYEEYIKQWGNWHKHIFKNISGEVLTQEEFNLLKEVLENE